MIKLLTGWSNQGGSTVAHINLINAFNSNGMGAMLYGPHEYHLDKCNADKLENFKLGDNDTIITHYLKFTNKPKLCRKFIYSCHETNLTPLSSMDMSSYDLIHYVSDSQRIWHNVNYPYVIIPNVISKLEKNINFTDKAGVIGSIDRHKNTHISIERAYNDGFEKVLLMGCITDLPYYEEKVKPWIDKGIAEYLGYMEDKQKMYSLVEAVYHSSTRETFNYIKAECEIAGVMYSGTYSAESGAEYWDTDKVVNKWKEVLDL